MRTWTLWLMLVIGFGTAGAQPSEPTEVQAKRYLHQCITQAATHFIDQGQPQRGLTCHDVGVAPANVVLSSAITVTGAGGEDFYVTVTDTDHHQYEGDLENYPVLPPLPRSSVQRAQARATAVKVGAENLTRQCEQFRAGLDSSTSPVNAFLLQASCEDLGFDPEKLQLGISAGVSPIIQKTLRQCLSAVETAWDGLSPEEFKALDGATCFDKALKLSALTRKLGPPQEVQSSRIDITGPSVNDVRVTLTDKQGGAFQLDGQEGGVVLTAGQRRSLALKNDAAPVFYACLIRLDERVGSTGVRDGASCDDLGVNTYGLRSEIHLFPWTTQKYQLTFTPPSGEIRRWPDLTLPTESQLKTWQAAKARRELLLSNFFNALFAFLAFNLFVRIPRIRVLDSIFAGLGFLSLALIVPTLWTSTDFGDAVGIAFAYLALAGFALFGASLWLPYASYWRLPLKSSFGMAFIAGMCMMLVTPPVALTLGVVLANLGGSFVWWVYPVMGVVLAMYWWWKPSRANRRIKA